MPDDACLKWELVPRCKPCHRDTQSSTTDNRTHAVYSSPIQPPNTASVARRPFRCSLLVSKFRTVGFDCRKVRPATPCGLVSTTAALRKQINDEIHIHIIHTSQVGQVFAQKSKQETACTHKATLQYYFAFCSRLSDETEPTSTLVQDLHRNRINA